MEAVPVVAAGGKIQVVWAGPDNKNDIIVIAEPDAEGKKWVAYTYTRSGNPLTVKVPSEPGSYELRYVTAQEGTVLARLPFSVN